MACLFHGSTAADVLEAMPSLNVHQQSLQRALAFDYSWDDHSIFVTHNDPNTKRPKVSMKEVLSALHATYNTQELEYATPHQTHQHIKHAID
jgi:UDP-N-acetylmuramyl tripeptide synthase